MSSVNESSSATVSTLSTSQCLYSTNPEPEVTDSDTNENRLKVWIYEVYHMLHTHTHTHTISNHIGCYGVIWINQVCFVRFGLIT